MLTPGKCQPAVRSQNGRPHSEKWFPSDCQRRSCTGCNSVARGSQLTQSRIPETGKSRSLGREIQGPGRQRAQRQLRQTVSGSGSQGLGIRWRKPHAVTRPDPGPENRLHQPGRCGHCREIRRPGEVRSVCRRSSGVQSHRQTVLVPSPKRPPTCSRAQSHFSQPVAPYGQTGS
ncbi:hypothetical protein D3C81_1626790 [compost metagenome]